MPTIISIAGPSLAGKTILKSLLVQSQGCVELVTCTTRQPRQGETDGKDYHFLSHGDFEKMINDGGLIEYAEHVGNFYGLSKKEISSKIKNNNIFVVVLEPTGMQSLKKFCKEHNINNISIFITNPDEVLASRFLERFKKDSLANIDKYAQRMIAMFTKEKYVWGAEQEKTHLYDLIYTSFNDSNSKEIISDIVNYYNLNTEKKINRKNKTPNSSGFS